MNEKYCTIEYYGTINRGKSKHRPRNDSILFDGIYPFIQTGDVTHSNFYITTYSETYNEVGLAQSKLWNPGTLCITIAANIADSAILKIPACFPDSIIGFIPHENRSDVRFIKYSLDTLKMQIIAIAKGTTQDNLSIEKLKRVKFIKTNFKVQKKIAAILSAYDDLIDNNNRRIAILEKMAEEIYKEWFVRMRFPGHEKTKFIKGVPEGWEVKPIGSIFEISRGRVISTESLTDGIYPVIGGGLSFSSYHNEANTKAPVITISASGANAGFVNIYFENVWASDCSFIDSRSTKFIFFAFLLLKGKQEEIFYMQRGSAQPHVYAKDIMAMGNIFPDIQLIEKFEEIIKSLFEEMIVIRKKNTVLEKTRNALLPRLISGKLDVEKLDIVFPPNMKDEEMEAVHA